jgi:hypothetical protein
VKPDQAALWADQAADDSLKAAQIAQREAKKAATARREIDTRFPTDHEQMVQALATQEASAFLRIGPKRNRWRDLLEFEERLAEIEQRRTALLEEIAALNLSLNDEPARHTDALARWLAAGEEGERPASRALELQAAVADKQAEYEALGKRYDATLIERAEHVASNRRRFQRDVEKAKEKAASEYRRLVDELEAKRQELLDLRATEVWAGVFPSEALHAAPQTLTLVGAVKRIQEPLLPGVKAGIAAESLFALLRADATFCESVATVEQAAALEGKTAAELTGRVAKWQDGKPDIVGPSFPAVWRGSADETQVADAARDYAEAMRKRLWEN